MGLKYQINAAGDTFAGSTTFLSQRPTFSFLEDFFLNGTLWVESAIGASNFETTDANNFDIGLFIGESGTLPAGTLGFASNTLMHRYNGGGFSQEARLDVVNQFFDSNLDLWRFAIEERSNPRSVVLNFYRNSSSLLSAEKSVFAGEVTLSFSPDLRSVEGIVSLEAVGYIDPTTAYYEANFEGDLVELYTGSTEPNYYLGALLEQVGFDASAYLNSNGDLRDAFGNNLDAARQHYLQYGLAEGRLVDFAAVAYLATYDDLITAFGYNPDAARQHYQQSGIPEGRSISFEADDYIASHGDLIQAFGYNLEAAAQHYISLGSAERRSRDSFDEVSYLNNYSDLRAAFGNNYAAATQHYISFGYGEGRTD
ncbi:MAG: hypothetical protein WA901_05315 [Phormidesmis sp.]